MGLVILFTLIVPFIAVLIIWFGQTLLDRKVTRLMRTESEFSIIPAPSESFDNNREGQTIKFEEKSYFWGNIEDSPQRKHLIGRSRARFKKDLHYNIVIGLGYIFLPGIALLLYSQDIDFSAQEYYYLGIFFILYHLFRYDLFINEITLEEKKGKDLFGYFLRIIYGIVGFLVNLLIRFLPKSNIIYPVIFFITYFSIAVSLMVENTQLRLGMIVAFGLHIYLKIRFLNYAKSLANYKLLILRVFNLESSTKFTFNEIWKYWRYIGSYLTVVDESLLNLQKRKDIWVNSLSILILVFFAQAILTFLLMWIGIESEEVRLLISGVLVILSIVLYFAYGYKKITQSFIGSKNDLDKFLLRISKNPVNILPYFKGYAVRCFDNTWSFVVEEFVKISDVIMMDLRGYSDSRKGCQQEVSHLLNLVPISKVTFVVGEEDLLSVKTLLENEYRKIKTTSPNYNTWGLRIKIYVVIGVRKVQYLNTQGIIAELLNSLQIETKTPTFLEGLNEKPE